VGLFFPQAAADKARRRTTRQIERMRGHPGNEFRGAIVMPSVSDGLRSRRAAHYEIDYARRAGLFSFHF
jgi:hypothetical protein